MATGPRLSIDCPHCGHKARVRTSRQETPLVRECNLQCTNLECGHTFAAQVAITHSIAPSQIPNPEIALPITPPSLRRSSGLPDLDSGRGLSRRPRPSNDNLGGAEVPPPASVPIAAVAAN